MKRKLPDTSHAANKAAVPEMRADHHKKIIQALEELGTANYEVIAKKLSMDRHQIGRRLSELERMEIVFKPGLKTKTSSGRDAYVYSLTSQPRSTMQVDDKIHNATKPEYVQKDLFKQ